MLEKKPDFPFADGQKVMGSVAIQEKGHTPAAVVGLFVHEFLSIPPFQDGNGRLSRLPTTLLLLKYGYGFIEFISFEHRIENRKTAYHRALMDCQKRRRPGKPEISVNTLKKDLQQLVREGRLEKTGQKKGTVYRVSGIGS